MSFWGFCSFFEDVISHLGDMIEDVLSKVQGFKAKDKRVASG